MLCCIIPKLLPIISPIFAVDREVLLFNAVAWCELLNAGPENL